MLFLQCPMADSWECITVGMKVEVINTDCPVDGEVYWIASVIRVAGKRKYLKGHFLNCNGHLYIYMILNYPRDYMISVYFWPLWFLFSFVSYF